MELQTAFYVIGIIVMSLVLALLIGVVVAVLVIRSKVNAIHSAIEHKLHFFTDTVDKTSNAVQSVKRSISHKK